MSTTTAIRLLAFLCLLLPASAFARRQDTGFLDRSISVGAETFRYQVFLPAVWDKHRKWPVILFLHGAGERGDDGLFQTDVGLGHAIRRRPADFPFVVVMPQCRRDHLWVENAMEAQALAALERSINEFNGDRSRLYLSGISMGGYGSWDLAVQYPHMFAAYVIVCGGIHAPPNLPALHSRLLDDPSISDPYAETARRVGKIPIWIFHGGSDPVVPVEESRKMYAALETLKGNVKYREFPGVGHESWTRAYAEPGLLSWLLAQKRR
jgi:predicted peptidase